MPLRFAKYNKASTLTGTLNSITYAGCALSNYIFGFTSDKFGWNSTIFLWLIIFIIGAFSSGIFIIKLERYLKK